MCAIQQQQRVRTGETWMLAFSVRLARFAPTGCALLITALNAWVLVASAASPDRDPFHFSSVMTSNAEMHAARMHAAKPLAGRAHAAESHTA
jgi:hypothetical protein